MSGNASSVCDARMVGCPSGVCAGIAAGVRAPECGNADPDWKGFPTKGNICAGNLCLRLRSACFSCQERSKASNETVGKLSVGAVDDSFELGVSDSLTGESVGVGALRIELSSVDSESTISPSSRCGSASAGECMGGAVCVA